MKICITGYSGFLGSYILKKLSKKFFINYHKITSNSTLLNSYNNNFTPKRYYYINNVQKLNINEK